MLALSSAHATQPFSASLLSIIENLPKIDLGVVARPLLQSMATTNELRPLLSALYNAEIDRHEDLNTLFRGQSLASRILYEVLNVYGHHYLVVTLKPIIDKIYKERKSCEIDPSRIGPGESLEKNMANLLSYFALMFNRVVDSAPRCPAPIKTLLADLRNVVRERTNRLEIERLALSSFLVMRFFAAAILNPRAFGLKKDQPDPRCARSLLLLSKILQRVANCCVSEQKLSTKEPWLTSVFTQVTDEQHITAMANFLDRMSLQQLEPSLSSDSIAVLKDGYLVETRTGPRHAWRNMLNPKRRYVMLTDTDLVWQKSHRGDFNPKGSVSLTDIRSLIPEGKSVLKLKTDKEEVAFETTGQMETTEWLTAIERQRARARRMSEKTELHELVDSDVERDLETLHMLLMGHADTLTSWKSCIEFKKSVPEGIPVIPNRLDGSTIENEAARTQHCESLCRTLEQTLNIVYAIEEAHRDALNAYTAQMMSGSGTRDEPIGDENYLVLKRQLNAQP